MILKCPVCNEPLVLDAKVAACANRHAFDVARSGYLNLLLANQRHSPEPGDSAEMMRSRRAFLQTGAYDPIADAVADAVTALPLSLGESHVADLGCGEGFFLSRVKARLSATAPANDARYYGVDISRAGVKMATTYDRAITWIVASVHSSPFLDHSVDAVISMFAPIATADVRRIVRDDGALVTVTPGPDHLDALRAILYSSVEPHPVEPALMAGETSFALAQSTRVQYPLALESSLQIMSLLAMTPYYWNISLETKARVEALERLDLTVDVVVTVFRPQGAFGLQA